MTAKSSLLISGSREEAPRAVPPFPCSPGSAVPLRPDGSSRSIRIPARCCVSSAAPSMLPARWAGRTLQISGMRSCEAAPRTDTAGVISAAAAWLRLRCRIHRDRSSRSTPTADVSSVRLRASAVPLGRLDCIPAPICIAPRIRD